MKKALSPVLKFHGVRGSRPYHLTDLLGYGGDSTCLEIDCQLDFALAIDGGSGLRHVISRLQSNARHNKLHILITHSHWDHVLFLPLIKALTNADFEIHIHAPDVAGHSFEELFKKLMTHGRLPIPAPKIAAKLAFHKVIPMREFVIEGKVKVLPFQVNHQHTTLGYRVIAGETSTAIITDAATIHNGNYLGEGFGKRAAEIGKENFEAEYNTGLVNILKDVHTLVFDTHFNAKNIKSDWGHASPEIALDLCVKANIRRLFMFHHAPEDNDAKVAMKQAHARALPGGASVEIINAREGDEWPLKSA